MNLDARQLLRRLEPAVRPAGVDHAGNGRVPLDRAGFDDLLARAATGEFASGLPVDGSGLDEPLDESFQERLALVADAAAAAGYGSVLVVCDDRPIVLEVSPRRLDGELAITGDELRPVDAAVRLSIGENHSNRLAAGPTAATVPPGIAEAILSGRPSSDPHPSQDAPGDAA